MTNFDVNSEKKFSQKIKNTVTTNQNNLMLNTLSNPYHGGVALGAIYAMDDLTSAETSVMIFIGSQTDFRGPTPIAPQISIKKISSATKISIGTIKRVLLSLVDKSYLYVENNFDERGFQIENTYFLSSYLFHKYAEMSCAMFGVAHHELTDSSPRASNNMSVATISEDSFRLAERSGEKEKEINTIDLTGGGSPEAEGDGLSLHQNDIEVIGDIVSASPHMSPPPDELDQIGFDTVKNQFDKRIKKARSEIKSDYKIVTEHHRKMLAIFRPTNPELTKKCRVRDNDILFFTDQVFEKYGQQSCVIIDNLFTYALNNGKCGELAWNVNTAWDLINIAKKELKNE